MAASFLLYGTNLFSMQHEDLTRLVRKYLAGNCTPSEEKELEQWWRSSLDDDRYKKEISELERETLKRKTLSNLQYAIRSGKQNGNARKIDRWQAHQVALLAACVAIFVVATMVLITFNSSPEILITSAFGERREIILPDQSVVVLNGNSSIRYSEWNENEDRNVWLEGEAYFSVVHTANNNRFVVNTIDSLTVEVLGTKFAVSNRMGQTNVVLREGKVRLEKASYTCIMKPNEMASYSKSQKTFFKQTVDADQKISWKDNLLVFEDESLQGVADRLKASHGLIIRFKNESDAREIFNGSIPGDSVELLFEKIETLYHLQVKRNDDGAYIVE